MVGAGIPRPDAGSRWRRLGLALLLSWAFALRIWHGSLELTSGRFWDERFGLQNIERLLAGHLKPANAFHPTLSYIPQALLLGLTDGLHRLTGWGALAVLDQHRFTPLAYFLCRFLQAVFGIVSVVWLVRVGRRVFDRNTGLLAGLLLAAAPWHIRQSVIYKPDILLLLLCVAVIDLSITAVLLPRVRSFLRAGVAVGLALATKYNAAPIALPLTVGTLLRRARRRQRLWGLVLAGIVAVAIFVALDLHLLLWPGMLRMDFGGTLKDYAHKGQSTSRWGVVLHAGSSLLSPTFHGPVLGAVALAGYAWLVVRALRSSERRRAVLATVFVYGPAYVAIYAAITTNPSAHNWLLLLPFTSLAAAAAMVRAERSLATRAPRSAKALLPVAVALLLVLTVGRATRYVYLNTVGTTWQEADAVIGSATAGSPQLVVLWHGGDGERARPLGPAHARAVVVPARRWRTLGLPAESTDVEIYDLAKVTPPASTAGHRTRRVEPALFHAHGNPLLVVLHPWQRVGSPRELRLEDGCFAPPEPAPHQTVSFEVALARLERGTVRMQWGDRDVPLFWGGRARSSQRWFTPRFAAFPGPSRICISGSTRPVRGVWTWTWSARGGP